MDGTELTSAFLIGHDVIDTEHAGLVDILNEMAKGLMAKDIGHCKEKWQLFCEKLEQHFASEEKIMASFDYVRREHNNHHSIMLEQMLVIGRDCNTLEGWEECFYQMRHEILSQILKYDLYFAEYLVTINYEDS